MSYPTIVESAVLEGTWSGATQPVTPTDYVAGDWLVVMVWYVDLGTPGAGMEGYQSGGIVIPPLAEAYIGLSDRQCALWAVEQVDGGFSFKHGSGHSYPRGGRYAYWVVRDSAGPDTYAAYTLDGTQTTKVTTETIPGITTTGPEEIIISGGIGCATDNMWGTTCPTWVSWTSSQAAFSGLELINYRPSAGGSDFITYALGHANAQKATAGVVPNIDMETDLTASWLGMQIAMIPASPTTVSGPATWRLASKVM